FGAGALPVLQVTLPIGISFYIFQSLSYPIDVYRGHAPPAGSFSDFACFVALFPQLIAGPIVRYNTVADQLVQRDHTLDKFTAGTALFILGFAKKILLANPMGGAADAVFAAASPSTVDAWFGVTAYAFQIYFDFAAYSYMAVGLGRMFGFEFLKNFDAPYMADSITDFWRRWHISLSTFLRDYLYIPLGGNRYGERRTYLNLTIVMLLGGLWHGANWTFIIWGAYHGGLLALERRLGKEPLYTGLPRALRMAITFVLVLFSWVLFRSATITDAGAYFSVLLWPTAAKGGSLVLDALLYTRGNMALMILCAAFTLCGVQAHDWVEKITLPRALLLVALFCVALMNMHAQAFNPFLYFQF
ncbi:MAG: MBOAT family protein, partial [Candidatus Hydrogenedentes bacterium]|nr:MBOAT family protein [Candidatus Hydrogenedentota bacterium]